MSGIYNWLSENYNYVFYELNDDRIRDLWPSFGTLLTIIIAYLYFVKVIGPKWMENKKPYELKNTIIFYNVFQIVANAYVFYESFFNVWIANYNWTCQPVDYTDSLSAKKVHGLVWLYLMLKLIDLLDTVFYVLRKKKRQISALHTYHHFMMTICAWICYKYYPNGHSTLLGVINCLVHSIMYTYYLIAGLGPQYQEYLWWKKYVTSLQLVQFAIIFLHNSTALLNGCNYPKWITVCLSINALHFVYMFGNFYYVNYIKTKNNETNKNKNI